MIRNGIDMKDPAFLGRLVNGLLGQDYDSVTIIAIRGEDVHTVSSLSESGIVELLAEARAAMLSEHTEEYMEHQQEYAYGHPEES